MFFNPIIAILHNQKTNAWHPILFTESPLPGPPSADKPIRHKSKMHHTTGFPERNKAVDYSRAELAQHVPGAKFALKGDIEWDGEDTPALVLFFGEVDGELRPLL